MRQSRNLVVRGMVALALILCWGPAVAEAGPAALADRPGWVVTPTSHGFAALGERLEAAVKAAGMVLVFSASASEGASAQGFTIAGNRVVGVFRNDFARRMLAASIPAGIEAPIRFYLTENADGTATLSYRAPSAVFEPYLPEAAPDLGAVARELDAIFASIAGEAARP